MGLLSVLQTAVRGAKQIPAMMNAATHEDDPEFIAKYGMVPTLPYSGEITPGGPTHDMDFGGGQGDMTGGEVKHHVSKRPNMLGKILQAAPGILSAGIAGAARPNIAGGGAADVFRAADAGGDSINERQDRQRNIARQKEQDVFRRKVWQSQIEDHDALAAQRRAKAAEANAPPDAQAIGKFGWYDRVGVWHPAPTETNAVDPDKAATNSRLIGNAGGYELPERNTFSVPTGSPVPGQGTMQSTVSNVPPPEGYNNLPGTSGDHRIVMPGAELKGDLRHPDKPTPVRYIKDAQGNMTAVRLDADGNPIETKLGAKGTPQRTPAGKPSLQQTVDQRTAIAAQHPEWSDQDRKLYSANGRLPTGGGGKPKKSIEELTALITGSPAMGGGNPAGNPRATPGAPKPAAQLPPEISAKLQVGKNTKIKAPDGSVQMWVKGPDGSVKRLR